MASPEVARRIVAADGASVLHVLPLANGNISLRLSHGSVAITASFAKDELLGSVANTTDGAVTPNPFFDISIPAEPAEQAAA